MSKNKTIGLISLILGIAVLIGAANIKVAKMAVSMGDPGPKVFPFMAGGLLTLCGIGLFFSRQEDGEVFMTREQWLRVAALFGVFIGYVVLLYLFGFIIATPVLFFLMITMFAGEQKVGLPVRIGYAIGLTAVIYVLFVVLLKTYVPQGIVL